MELHSTKIHLVVRVVRRTTWKEPLRRTQAEDDEGLKEGQGNREKDVSRNFHVKINRMLGLD